MIKILKPTIIVLVLVNLFLIFSINSAKTALISAIEYNQVSLNSDKISTFKNNLPEEKDMLNTISQISKTAAQLNLNMPGVHYSPEKNTKNGFKNITFTFSVEGDYRNIRKFIYKIETLRKLIFIESLNIRKASAEKETIIIDIQVSAFFKG